MKRVLRNVQTFFPFLQDVRFNLASGLRKAFKHVHDKDWRAFEQLKVGEGVVVDVGANRGQSLDSFQLIMSGRSIVSFEPNVRLAAKLARRYRGNKRVTIEPVALSSGSGRQKLYLPKYRNWVFDGLASLDPEEALNWLNPERMYRFSPKNLSHIELDIEVKTLDEFNLTPSIIKIDVQGLEYDVLRGATKTISACRPIILVEGGAQNIVDLLSGFDYRPYSFCSGVLQQNDATGKNVFFLTDAHRSGA